MAKRISGKSLAVVIIILVMLLILINVINIIRGEVIRPQYRIIDSESDILDVYEGELQNLEDKSVFSQNGIDYKSPWMMARNGIHYVRNNDLLLAQTILRNLMETFYRNGYFPRDEYQDFETGWVSCMDAPVVCVLAQMMYEKTDNIRYKQFVEDLIPYMTAKSDKGGYILELDQQKWLLEYCGKETDAENAEYVLNGSLIGTLSTYLVAAATNNKELYSLAESSRKLYEKYADEYWYQNDVWCYYMRGKGKVVNQDHYVIFELRILKALFELTKDDFYEKEVIRRMDLLKRYYQLYVDEHGNYTFVRAGAPHYYYIDIGNTKLTFYDKEGFIIREDFKQGRAYEDSCMVGRLPEETAYVIWSVDLGYYSVNMGELKISYIEDGKGIELLGANYDVSGCGKIDKNIISYDENVTTTSRVTIHGDLNSELEPCVIYGIELDNVSDNSYAASVVIYDTTGNAIGRYVKDIVSGKNLVIFSYIGCKENFEKALLDIHDYTIRVYLANQEDICFKLGNTIKFENAYALFEYLRTSDYQLNFGQ